MLTNYSFLKAKTTFPTPIELFLQTIALAALKTENVETLIILKQKQGLRCLKYESLFG